jgi:hypothetical protein
MVKEIAVRKTSDLIPRGLETFGPEEEKSYSLLKRQKSL